MFAKALIALAVAASALAQDLTINSPAALIQCQPALISWNGGQSPYFIAVIPGSQPSAAALKDFGTQTGNSLTWVVDLAAGTSVTLRATDFAGTVNYNQAVSIQPGSSDSCLNAAASAAGGNSTIPLTTAGVTSGAMTSSAAAVSGAASSAASAVSSARASASGTVTSLAASGSSAVASGSRQATNPSASSGAAAAASSSGAASHFTVETTGLLAMFLGAVGVTLF